MTPNKATRQEAQLFERVLELEEAVRSCTDFVMKLSESHEELKKTHQALSDKYEEREALVDGLVSAARTSTKSVDEVDLLSATFGRHTSPSPSCLLVGSSQQLPSPKCTGSPAHATPQGRSTSDDAVPSVDEVTAPLRNHLTPSCLLAGSSEQLPSPKCTDSPANAWPSLKCTDSPAHAPPQGRSTSDDAVPSGFASAPQGRTSLGQRSRRSSLSGYFDRNTVLSYDSGSEPELTRRGRKLSDASIRVKKAAAKITPKWIRKAAPRWMRRKEKRWMMHREVEHEMVASVWSVPLVAGLLPVGRAASVVMLLLLAVNTGIQVFVPANLPTGHTLLHFVA